MNSYWLLLGSLISLTLLWKSAREWAKRMFYWKCHNCLSRCNWFLMCGHQRLHSFTAQIHSNFHLARVLPFMNTASMILQTEQNFINLKPPNPPCLYNLGWPFLAGSGLEKIWPIHTHTHTQRSVCQPTPQGQQHFPLTLIMLITKLS